MRYAAPSPQGAYCGDGAAEEEIGSSRTCRAAYGALIRGDNAPLQRHAAGDIGPVSRPLWSVHIPDNDIAGLRILPDQIRSGVSVYIRHPDDPPGKRDTPRDIVPVARPGCPVHVPDNYITGLSILPDQVGIAIALGNRTVEVEV